MFDYAERRTRWDGNLRKNIKWLEQERDRLTDNDMYWTKLRPLKTDTFGQEILAELRHKGPRSRKQLMQKFGKSDNAMSSVGMRLQKSGRIVNVRRGGLEMWALADSESAYTVARNAIMKELAEGEKTLADLVERTGKRRNAIKRATLIRYSEGMIVRTAPGTYGLPGKKPAYAHTSTRDGIVDALTKDKMTTTALAAITGKSLCSIHITLRKLISTHKVIRTSRSSYALPGIRPACIPTRDGIIKALAKGEMRFSMLVKKTGRTETAVFMALDHLQKEGTVVKVRRGVYDLEPRQARERQNASRRSVARREAAATRSAFRVAITELSCDERDERRLRSIPAPSSKSE